MARSKIKGTDGNPLKKGTNRSKLMASVTYTPTKDKGVWNKTQVNDGDKSTYAPGMSTHRAVGHQHEDGVRRQGPGPGRPNLIRKSTTEKVTHKAANEAIMKAASKRKKK